MAEERTGLPSPVVDEATNSIKDLTTVLQSMMKTALESASKDEDRQSIMDKMKQSLLEQRIAIQENMKALDETDEKYEEHQQQISDTTEALTSLDDVTYETADAVTVLSDIISKRSSLIQDTPIPDTADDDSGGSDDPAEETRPLKMDEEQFAKWLEKADVSTFEKIQAQGTREMTTAMAEFSPVGLLKDGISVAVPEMIPLVEFLAGNRATRAAKWAWKRFIQDRKIRKQEERARITQQAWFENNQSDDPMSAAEFQAQQAEKNTWKIHDQLQNVTSSIGGIFKGKEWKKDNQEAFRAAMSGMPLNDPEQAKKWFEGVEATVHKSDLEKIIDQSTLDSDKITDIFNSKLLEGRDAAIAGDTDKTAEIEEYLTNLHEIKKAIESGQKTPEVLDTIKEKISGLNPLVESEQEQIENLNKSIELLIGLGHDSLSEAQQKELTLDPSNGKDLGEALGTRGSPPYLETLTDYFTGGKFESSLSKTVATDAPATVPETPETPKGIKFPEIPSLKDIGTGIIDGIRAFLDGLTGLVQSALNFFQTFIKGIGNMIQKVAKIISKTFINLMKGLGEGIASLFRALGSIDPYSLTIGAAALGAVAVSLLAFGLALKLAAPFVKAVFGGIAKIISSIGKVIKVVSGAIVDLMEGITENLIKLTQVPFMDYIKLAGAFVALGAGLFFFGNMSYVAIPALLALGVASIGLAQLLKVLPADQMSLMAKGFHQLAKAVKHFGLNSLFLGPAVGLLTALSMIPFADKIIDLALQKGDVTGSVSPELFKADTMVVGSVRGAASQALMDGSDRAMQARIENSYQAEKSGGNNTITTTAVNNSENNYIGKQTAQDVGLQNSLISVVH